MLFAYDVENLEPVYFSAYSGNLIDSKAYIDFIEQNDIRDSILMGDKEFTLNAARKQLKGDRTCTICSPYVSTPKRYPDSNSIATIPH